MPQSLKSSLRTAAMQCGAVAVGFTGCKPVDKAAFAKFQQWIAADNHGEMAYMANYTDIRRNPELLLPGARTIIVCAFSYYHPEKPTGLQFAMYAHGDDYHEVLRHRLQPLADTLKRGGYTCRICVDSAPIIERYWAQQAGIGFVGLNHTLIVPGHGSYVFLAEILTDAEIPTDRPCPTACDMCMKCVQNCPAGALRANNGFDARRCLSYLTIEHRGVLPETIEGAPISRLLSHCVYGCDTCQSVCPHNTDIPITTIEEFRLRPQMLHITRNDILSMSTAAFADIFRHSAVKRLKLSGLYRNASLI